MKKSGLKVNMESDGATEDRNRVKEALADI